MKRMSERLAEIQRERWSLTAYGYTEEFLNVVFDELYENIRDAAVLLKTGVVKYSDLAVLYTLKPSQSGIGANWIEVAASMAYCVSEGVPMQDQEVTSAPV